MRSQGIDHGVENHLGVADHQLAQHRFIQLAQPIQLSHLIAIHREAGQVVETFSVLLNGVAQLAVLPCTRRHQLGTHSIKDAMHCLLRPLGIGRELVAVQQEHPFVLILSQNKIPSRIAAMWGRPVRKRPAYKSASPNTGLLDSLPVTTNVISNHYSKNQEAWRQPCTGFTAICNRPHRPAGSSRQFTV